MALLTEDNDPRRIPALRFEDGSIFPIEGHLLSENVEIADPRELIESAERNLSHLKERTLGKS